MPVSLIHRHVRTRPPVRGRRWVIPGRTLSTCVAVAAMVGSVLSGCTGATGDQGQTPHITGASTPAVPSSVPTSSSMAGMTATSGRPAGTVVPFRTVTPDSGVGKRIGLVAPTGSDPFGKAVTDSVAAQVKAAGAELVGCDPGDDPALVLDCARRLATEHVDGWITVQSGDLGQALCDAGPQGVPLITIAAVPVRCQSGGVGADDEQAGFLVGRALGRVPRNRSACERSALVILGNTAAGTVSAERIAGIRSGFAAQCPFLTTAPQILDAGTQDRAYNAFTAVLTSIAGDAVVLVAAVNDAAALGVVAAIPTSRSAHVVVAAIGADQRARCEMLADPAWIGDAALFPERYGEVAVPALLDAMAGRKVPPSMYVRSTFVSSATLGDFYDVSECPTQ